MVEDYSTGPQGQVYGGTSQVDQEKCTLKTDKYLLRNATATDINLLSKCLESDFSSLSHFVIFFMFKIHSLYSFMLLIFTVFQRRTITEIKLCSSHRLWCLLPELSLVYTPIVNINNSL